MVMCRCGKEAIILTSWTDNNPGRRFYGCPDQGSTCGFLGWYDLTRCQRCVDIIPGLLRARKNLEAANRVLVDRIKVTEDANRVLEEKIYHSESNSRKLKKMLVYSWIGFMLIMQGYCSANMHSFCKLVFMNICVNECWMCL
ncbi:putative DNA topoisomerase transcription factor GRF family [Helianthus annuus]|nr:putative DNA topoisomerase transcription factor GRF family [Helianthus annuus]